MLKILVKKQLAEIFRMYLYNAKKNKARSKVSTILMFIMFGAVMIGILGGMFGFMAWAMRPVIDMGLGWLYFLIFTGVGILLGAFGSIFNTYSGLYLAKDNDLLLAMPIPVGTLMISRLLSVYLLGVMYSAVVALPAIVIYLITAGPNVSNIIGSIIWYLLVSVLVFVLSCVLGYVVARLSTKMKHKNFTTVAATILFITLYYVVYFKAAEMMRGLIENAMTYGEKMKNSWHILYRLGCIPTGDWAAMAAGIAAAALLVAAVGYVMARSFVKIATSTGRTSHITYRERTAKQKSVFGAMLGKEFARFTGSANYMLNSGLGILMLILAGDFMLVKGSMADALLRDVFGEVPGSIAVILCGMIVMIASMNDMTAPSVALEGKNIWISHSLPVPAKTALRAKVAMHLILTEIPTLFCSICACIAFTMPVGEKVMVILIPLVYVFVAAMFGLFMGMLNPNLNWTNEMYPIKQSLAVLAALFSGWIVGIGMILPFLMLEAPMSVTAYLGCVLGVLILLAIILTVWFEKKAAEKFERL